MTHESEVGDMQYFVVKYILPDGRVVGYHTCTFCTVKPNLERAKRYRGVSAERITEQLAVIRKNFESIWNWSGGVGERYRSNPIWESHSFQDISIVAELVAA